MSNQSSFGPVTPVDYAGVRSGLAALHIFVCMEPKIAKCTAFRIGVDNLDDLYAHCENAGIVHPNGSLRTQPWGSRDFAVVDPAGVLVTFWQELES